MGYRDSDDGGLPESVPADVRIYLANLKVAVLLGEITAQLEAVAAGGKPSPETLAGIRRGIEALRMDNDGFLAALGCVTPLDQPQGRQIEGR